jgi:hypothetical protein
MARIDKPYKPYNVTIRFQYPAWDEVDGIVYRDIQATCKSDAIKQVRREAENDGHVPGIGKGRASFKAVEVD